VTHFIRVVSDSFHIIYNSADLEGKALELILKKISNKMHKRDNLYNTVKTKTLKLVYVAQAYVNLSRVCIHYSEIYSN